MGSPHDETLRRFEERLAELESAHYLFTLFVAGASDLSARAIANIREVFEFQLRDRYTLEVVDVYRDPQAMTASNVLAAPTLIREAPLPNAGSSVTCPTQRGCCGYSALPSAA